MRGLMLGVGVVVANDIAINARGAGSTNGSRQRRVVWNAESKCQVLDKQ